MKLNLNFNSNLHLKKENNIRSAIIESSKQNLEKMKKMHIGSDFSKRI